MWVLQEKVQENKYENIKNLFHFANMAKENWEEAVTFFGSEEFPKILVNSDRQAAPLYRLLVKEGSIEQAMDEFLVAVHKKERVSLWLEKSEAHLYPVHIDEDHIISIVKESWGFVEAKVYVLEKEQSFVRLQKKKITEDDFVGDTCQIAYTINKSKLHQGINQTRICIETPFQKLCFDLTVEREEKSPLQEINQKLLKYRIEFLQLYVAYSKKELSAAGWVGQSLILIDKILGLDSENQEWQLVKSQFLFLAGKEAEGKGLLGIFDDGKILKENNVVLYGYYLYLQACYKKDAKNGRKTAEELWKLYQQNEEPFPILWMLFQLDEELKENLPLKWKLLKEQYGKGCISPILYIEALKLLHKDETLLEKVGGFETHLLLFACKRKYFQKKWLPRILSLSMKSNQYHPLLYTLYKKCYEMEPGKDWLMILISLLIRSGEKKSEYLEWYELGVSENIKISGIFEKFIEHLEYREDKKLPRSVIEYFAHDAGNIRNHHKAHLYRLILEYHMEAVKRRIGSFAHYEKLIHYFVQDRILHGKVSKDLGLLYNQYVDEEMLENPKLKEKFGQLIFVHQVKCKWKSAAKVWVHHKYLEEIEEYPVENGQALVPVYSSEDTLVIVDAKGRKYAQAEDIIKTPLIKYEEYLPLYQGGEQPLGIMVYREAEGQRYRNITQDNQNELEFLIRDTRFEKAFRMEVEMGLLQYYQEEFMSGKLRKALEEVQVEDYQTLERGRILDMLLGEGMYGKAYTIIRQLGFEYVDTRLMVGLIQDKITEQDFAWREDLVRLCYEVMKKGKYTETMLIYLEQHYEGSLQALKEIWDLTKEFNLDNSSLSRRILYTISVIDEISEGYEEFLDCQIRENRELPWVCKLAFLKLCVQKDVLEEEKAKYAYEFLLEALKKGQIYSYFPALERLLKKDLGLCNQVIIEHKTTPGSQVWLHYLLETKEEGEGKYRSEKMEAVMEGIYTRSFTLYDGEKLHYYIREGNGENLYLKEEHTICGVADREESDRRFSLLNQIVADSNQENWDGMFAKMDQYIFNDYLVEKLYKPL